MLFNTHSLGFEILDTNNCKNIIFLDTSTYGEEPENPILEILLPGFSKYLIVQIQPRKVNVLNSNTIGLTSIFSSIEPMDLPDGVYRFKYKVCPYDYYNATKFVLRTVEIDRQIANIYHNIDLCECLKNDLNTTKKELLDIYIFLESAKANALHGYIDKAGKDYEIALKKVSKLTDKIIK